MDADSSTLAGWRKYFAKPQGGAGRRACRTQEVAPGAGFGYFDSPEVPRVACGQPFFQVSVEICSAGLPVTAS